jgi:predicted nuclease of predicted toxin-antitoxin system
MRILLDHCVPRRYMRLLTLWEHEVELMASHIPPDAPDADVIQLAGELDAILLTIDLDFANILDYPPEQYGGIVVMRYVHTDEEQLDATLKTALADMSREALRGVLVIVTSGRYRIRR